MDIESVIINRQSGTVYHKVACTDWAALGIDEDVTVPLTRQFDDVIGTATLHADGRVTGKIDDPEKVLGRSFGLTVALRGLSISTDVVVLKEN